MGTQVGVPILQESDGGSSGSLDGATMSRTNLPGLIAHACACVNIEMCEQMNVGWIFLQL